MSVQKISVPNLQEQLKDQTGGGRIETGPLEIRGDWCGVFIRGDDCINYAMHLQMLLDTVPKNQNDFCHGLTKNIVQGLCDTLKSAYQK